MTSSSTTMAGELRGRLAVERRAKAEDGYGNEIEGEWKEDLRVWARVLPLRGGENVIAQRLSGVQPVVVTVRRSSQSLTIDPNCRLRDVHTDVTYAVTAPAAAVDGRREFLDILATSGKAE